MIRADGRACAEEIQKNLIQQFHALGRTPVLCIVRVGEDSATTQFIEQKKRAGAHLGVDVKVYVFPETLSGTALRKKISDLVHGGSVDGLVIQLPLPPHIQAQDMLNAVPPRYDVDALSARSVGDSAVGKSRIAPPVVGAIDALARRYGIEFRGKKICIVGAGRLVGKPVAAWLSAQGIGHCLVTDATPDVSDYTSGADIIITGVGKPAFITADMVKEGVAVFDAGASESRGRLVGDVDADAVSRKASFLTPVPGGIGPLTVTMIFQNLLSLIQSRA